MLRQVESKLLGEDNDATNNYTNRHLLDPGFLAPGGSLIEQSPSGDLFWGTGV